MKLTYSEIINCASELNNSANSMDTILSEVKSLLNQVTDTNIWSGPAASDAKNNFDILSSKFPEFVNSINEFATYLNSMVKNIQELDHELVESLEE